MDNKRLILLTILMMALMTLWIIFMPWLGERLGYDMSPQRAEPVTPAPVEPARPTLETPPGEPGPADPQPGRLRVLTQAEPRTVILGSPEPNHPQFPLQLTLNSVGAGIDEVLLNEFRTDVAAEERYRFAQPYPAQPDGSRPLATNLIELQGQVIDLSRVAWEVETGDETSVWFYVDLGTDEGPLARVRKLIRIFPRQVDGTPDPRGGYEMLVRKTVENLGGEELRLRAVVNGPTVPPRELDYGHDRMIIAGYRGRNLTVVYQGWEVERFGGDERRQDLVEPGEPPPLWVGASSIYFNAIVRPVPLEEPTGAEVPVPAWIQQVVAEALNPDEPDRRRRQVTMRIVTSELSVPAGERLGLDFRVFVGPKQRELLKNAYYASGPMRYDTTLVSPFGCTWCVFQPVVDVLVWLLTGFYFIFRDWGLAIVALVVLVRLLLHPITKRSQRSMMRMAKLGPEMEKLKKKYGDDKEAMTKAMQEFYREHGMAALPLGCLPLFLQMPIWIALYSTLQAEFRLRHSPFLYGWTWIDDLARPDHLIDFGQTYQVLFIAIGGLNLLPILLGVVFWFQMKLQPQPAAMTPEMKTQQNIMKWMMVLMFPIFLYPAPSGLNLYILTSTLIGIWESKRVRDQFKREEEAQAAAAPTLVKDKAPRSARGKKAEKEVKPAPATGWRAKLQELHQNLQKHVEDAQKQKASRRGSQGKR